MSKGKRIAVKLVILFISIFCLNGGRSILPFSSEVQIHLALENPNDSEMPHQHHQYSFNDDAKWLGTNKIEFSCFNYNPVCFSYTPEISSQEFLNSIWQPPKFV
jgi:hypothetical protein